jgi:hypothetical protein
MAFQDSKHNSVIAMMASLQKQLEQCFGRDRDHDFFTHVFHYLSVTSGRHVQLESWTITPYEVEFEQEIGSGGLFVPSFYVCTC